MYPSCQKATATLSQDRLYKMEENEIYEFCEMTDQISQATAPSLSATYSSKKSRSLSNLSATSGGVEKIDLTGKNSVNFNDNKGHLMTHDINNIKYKTSKFKTTN